MNDKTSIFIHFMCLTVEQSWRTNLDLTDGESPCDVITVGIPLNIRRGASAFNWWKEICCTFLKKISSLNAFYVFLPLFKHQTTPYIVQFAQKICLSFFFSNRNRKSVGGASQQQKKPHVHAVCTHYTLWVLFST